MGVVDRGADADFGYRSDELLDGSINIIEGLKAFAYTHIQHQGRRWFSPDD